MKLHYSKGEWGEFFAYAQFYRKRFEPRDYHEVLLLEPLALLRHCQFKVLESLVDRLRPIKPQWRAELDQVQALARIQFRRKPSKTEQGLGAAAHLDGKTLWKSSNKNIVKYHPRNMRVKVENLCE